MPSEGVNVAPSEGTKIKVYQPKVRLRARHHVAIGRRGCLGCEDAREIEGTKREGCILELALDFLECALGKALGGG
jgi:hypothetical protein